jgi:glycosyltransferase involved in cell wall biosynthesis
VPYGAHVVDDDAADELERLGIVPGEYVLTVARLVAENNVPMTIEALDRLGADERPPHVIVGTAGSRSPLESQIGAVVRSRDDVRWLGHVANQRLLAQLFRHCAIYVHGHSVGGTNPSLLQAMGAGAPTVCFDTAFNREVVANVDIYYRDASTLADQLRRLLGSAVERERLSEHGQARIRAQYMWADACRRCLGVLEDVATGRRRDALAP